MVVASVTRCGLIVPLGYDCGVPPLLFVYTNVDVICRCGGSTAGDNVATNACDGLLAPLIDTTLCGLACDTTFAVMVAF